MTFRKRGTEETVEAVTCAIERGDMEDLFTIIHVHMADQKLAVPFEYLQAFVTSELVALDWDFPEYYRDRLNWKPE